MAIDLDAARAARREAKKVGPVIRFNKKNYKLPVEVPFEALEQIDALDDDEGVGTLIALAKILLGEHYDAIIAGKPSVQDISVMLNGIMEEYGLGESEASSD